MHGERKHKTAKKKWRAEGTNKRNEKNMTTLIDEAIAGSQELLTKDLSSLRTFADFPLSNATKKGLSDAGFTAPTDIQRDSLPHTLSGADVVGAAKTGSGKTLALVIPLLECLWRNKWSRDEGLGALVISPTRELALQTFKTINKVGKYHEFSACLLIGGGTDVEYEKTRLSKMNIIVCTPGRLLQHLDENHHFRSDQLQILVIDEADRILDMGFAQQLNSIVEFLPTDRQNLLFSATQTTNVKELSRVCSKDPVFVCVHENSTHATPDELKQLYLVCDEQAKINTLWSFITTHRKSKILVFVSTCRQARFIYESFCHMMPGIILLGLWGSMKQNKRIEVFERFERERYACLIATDVASRGLDFMGVNWVVQVDAPPEIDDYIHRVGRTARMGKEGQALLFVTPHQEHSMKRLLELKKIPVERMDVDPRALKDMRRKLQSTIAHFPELNGFAQRAFVSYVRSVYVMKNKDVFDVMKIDVKQLAESMGLVSLPRIRFLRRQGIELGGTIENQAEQGDNIGFGDEIDSIQEEDLFTIKKKDVFSAAKEAEDTKDASESSKTKVCTREDLARKIIRKKIKTNKHIVFDDDAEVTPLTSSSGPALGLDIEEAKREKAANEKADKAAHRARIKERKKAKKLKARGAKPEDTEVDLADADDAEDDEPNLDWLPRPEGFNSDDEDDLPAEYDPSVDKLLDEKREKGLKKRKLGELDERLKKKTKKAKIVSTKDAEKEALGFLNPF